MPPSVASAVTLRLRRAAGAAIGASLVATLAMLPLQTALIGGGWAEAIRGEPVRDVLLGTNIGVAWTVQLAMAALLVAASRAPQSRRSAATAIAAGLALISSSLSGHAMMRMGVTRFAHQANDALHLLAGGAWLGALVPLTIILARLKVAGDHRDDVVALRRFSTAGHGAVALVIATGIGNDVLVVGGWPFDWNQPYQVLLSLKIALVAFMTALALVNRYRFVPELGADRTGALRRLRAGTFTAIGLGLLVVGLVAVLGMLDPVP